MAERFANRVALVTGAGSGIGAAIALQLAREGAQVLVADLAEDAAGAVVETIRAAGGVAEPFVGDVADPGMSEALVDRAQSAFGALHLAVNNAGIGGPSAPAGEYPVDGWRAVIDVNLNGVFYGMRWQIPAILDSGGGAIVNMASILGSVGFRHSAAYVAAKHGVVGLTKTAAIEYAGKGVRVNAVGPAFIDTPLLSKNLDEATLGSLAGLHPAGRLGRSEEVSELTCFLLSDGASFITGSYHLVDGGYTAQ